MVIEAQSVNRLKTSGYLSHAHNNLNKLKKLGFHIKRALISIPTRPDQVNNVADQLSLILGAKMKSDVPHYFITLIHPSSNGKPAYIARMITSIERDGFDSIVREYGVSSSIYFFDYPPYCYYREPKDNDEPSRLFMGAINRLKTVGEIHEQNVAIMAGIGRSDTKLSHGADVISLARIALSLVDWGSNAPDKPLFILSTTRLTNENLANPIPQAYLLNRLFEKLKMRPEWLGVSVVRAGSVRTHPTGAVIVRILPQEYDEKIRTVMTEFNLAVGKMRKLNKI
ncbi:hypothetical protein HZA76_04950 [Candidatus Roizmanbacteria bacterium]|nr:hypothetical protein [Candidatus Roizmanbacteria bacterium]